MIIDNTQISQWTLTTTFLFISFIINQRTKRIIQWTLHVCLVP